MTGSGGTDPVAGGVGGKEGPGRGERPRIRWPLLVLALLALPMVAFVLPVVGIIARNGEHFDGAYDAGWRVYLAAAAVAGVGVGLWTASRTAVGRVAFTCYLLATPAFVAYQLLPVVRRSVSLALVGVAVVAIAVVVVRRGSPRATETVAVLASVILVALSVSTVAEVLAPPPADVSASTPADGDRSAPTIPGRPAGDALPNVYHLILDEFQVDQFDVAVDDRTREALRGFTVFPEAVTSYGRTEMAVGELYGPASYDYSIPSVRYVQDALLDPSSTLQQLRAAGYRAEATIPNRSLWGTPIDPFDQVIEAEDAAQTDPGSDDSGLAASMWVDAVAPDAVTRRVIPERHYEQLANQALLPDDDPAIAVAAFRSFVHDEPQRAATGRYAVVHVIVPHRPYVLDRECGYLAGVQTDAVVQSRCALHLVDLFVEELKALGRFDASTIVVQGDHGAGLVRDGDGLVSAGNDIFGESWSNGRARPLLLVKPSGQGADRPLATSDRPALTTDVMATVFDSVGLPVEVAEDRVSLLADDFPDRPERRYHFYDKGKFGLPDRQVVRYVVRGDAIERDEIIPVPAP